MSQQIGIGIFLYISTSDKLYPGYTQYNELNLQGACLQSKKFLFIMPSLYSTGHINLAVFYKDHSKLLDGWI